MVGSTKNGVEKRLLELARMGLRTLVIAQKKLPTDEAEAWLREYSRAASAMEHRGEKMDACAANLEKGMELLGITAIEDRLQDEVPETIASLAQAGIVVWMLTGDKEETAINIGRSCKLVMNDNKLFMLCGIKAARDNESAKAGKEIFAKTIKEIYDDIVLNWVTGDTPATTGYRDPVSKRIIEVVLVMDGPSFAYFDYDKPEQTDMFLYIGKAVRSVISCRLTPNQKESVVHLIKTNTVPKATCLAIGDGANDVSMILEGDVGVGIFGKEGRQAANNADFAIGQFKFLKTLLLVHGRWNYIRQSQAFLYSLHKNAVITFMLFWYCYFTAVSGTSPFQSWVYSGYNLMLGLPIVFYGILDRDLSREFVEKNPEVYATGKDNVYLHGNAVIGWVANALCYACILCAIFYYAMAKTFLDYNILVFGCIAYTGLVMALQLKMIFMSNQWAYPQVSLMFISIIGMIIYYTFVQYWSVDNFYGAVGYMYSGNMFWLFGMFSVPMILMCFEALCYYTQLFFYPTNEMLYREIMHADKFENDMLGADSDAKHLVDGIEMNNSDGSNSSKEGKDQANSDVLL
jgi:phospholipid-translocating P-type ATPase (flippase)